MINLQEEKNYYILVDGQGGQFGGGRIFEGVDELVEQFQEWADSDGYEDSSLFGWSIGDCLSNWVFELKLYNGIDFIEVTDEFIKNNIIKK